MKSVGIVVEYNPFHNGHAYHVSEAKKASEAEVVVAVMSGYFLQRGEPALASKWARTKMALAGGVDIVIELPYVFATQKAEIFASGAISILDDLNVDSICFGSEEGKIESFLELLDFYREHEDELNHLIKQEVKKGVSYPKAASNAFQYIKKDDLLDLSLPNNILGFHYVKALQDRRSGIKPLTIARTKAGYHDPMPNDKTIASATSIRNQWMETKNLQTVQSFVPDTTYRILNEEYKTNGKLIQWEELFHLLKYKLLTTPPDELQAIYEIEEGIEFRLADKIKQAQSFQQFIELVKTKRFTWTRLQRMCTHILTNAKKTELQRAHESKTASYIRLLGMTEKGKEFLNRRKKSLNLPLISNYSKEHQQLLKHDEAAAHAYAMAFPSPIREQFIQMEYTQYPIQLFGSSFSK